MKGEDNDKSELEKQIEKDIQKDSEESVKPPVEESVKPPVEEQKSQEAKKEDKPSEKDNTIMYVGLGVGVIVIAGLAYFFLKRKRD